MNEDGEIKRGDGKFCAEIAEFYNSVEAKLYELESRELEKENMDELNLLLDELEERFAQFLDKLFLLTAKEFELIKKAGLNVSEYLRIRTKLESDYSKNQQTLEFFGLVDEFGSYHSEYNGTAENQPHAIDFTGKIFQMPTMMEITAALKPEQLKLYQLMEREGMEPCLQIAPIAYSMQLLMARFAENKDGFVDSKGEKLLRDIKLDDFSQVKDLRYGENVGMTSPGGSRGQFKSQWIDANNGFQVNIVATKPWIDKEILDEMYSLDDQQRSMTAGQLIQKSGKRFKELGFCGLTLETNLVALMNEYRTGEITTKNTQQFLLDNVKPGADSAPACAHTWMDILMGGYILDSGRDTMWVRPALRIKMSYQ